MRIFVEFAVIKSMKISFRLHLKPLRSSTNIQIRYDIGIIWNLTGFWVGSDCGSRYSEEQVSVDLNSIIRFIFLGLSSSFKFINFHKKFNSLVIKLL